MKKTFIKKIAVIMCAVMMLCSLSLNVSAQTVGVTDNEITDESTVPVTPPSEEVNYDISVIISEIITTVKQIIGDLIAYIAYSGEVDIPLAESGVAGYLYDPDEKCFYTSSDPWQRKVGYNEIFDVISPVTFIDFDTVRFGFDYNDKNWIIQMWKGQYGLFFYGAEIGVYNKPADRTIEHYDSVPDEDRLMMSMDFYNKDVRKFSRPYYSYWWCTGFIPGNVFGAFSNLRVDARITMKDYDMLVAFKDSIDSNEAAAEDITYSVKGLDVFIKYH